MANIRISKSGHTRAWLFPNGNSPKNKGEFLPCHRVVDPSSSFGDPEPIYKPSPTRFGEFIQIDTIEGAPERATFSIENYYTIDTQSIFLKIANLRCSSDLQVTLGTCVDPRVYNTSWQKLIIFEDVRITSHSLSDIGALQPDDVAATLETIEMSAKRYYEVVRLTIQRINAPVPAPTPLTWVVVYGTEECLECNDNIPGCVTQLAGGAGNLLQFTNDLGSTIGQTIISTILGNATAAAIAGEFLYVISDSDNLIHYASISSILEGVEIWGTIDPMNGGATLTGIVSDNSQDIWITDAAGNVIRLNSLRVISVRQLTTDPLIGISIYNECCISAWTATEIFQSADEGSLFTIITVPPAITTICDVIVTPRSYTGQDGDCNAFIVSGEDAVYCTTNLGGTWTPVGLPIPGYLKKMVRATRAVMYAILVTASGSYVVRSTDGGCTWTLLPDDPQKEIIDSDEVLCIDVCESNPNAISIVGSDIAGTGGWWIGSGNYSTSLSGLNLAR